MTYICFVFYWKYKQILIIYLHVYSQFGSQLILNDFGNKNIRKCDKQIFYFTIYCCEKKMSTPNQKQMFFHTFLRFSLPCSKNKDNTKRNCYYHVKFYGNFHNTDLLALWMLVKKSFFWTPSFLVSK